MDEQNNTTTNNSGTGSQPSTAPPVMDIRSSAPAPVSTPAPSVPTDSTTDLGLASEPANNTPSVPTALVPEVKPEETSHDETPPTSPSAPKKKSPMLVIVLAIIIALALGGVAYYLYDKNKGNPNIESQTAQPVADNVTPATTSDVDQTTQDVDTAVEEADKAGDVSDSDLTDSTLGL